MRIAIVGAGMAGLSCADALSAIGCGVTVFDKARGPGGRMSTRRIDTPLGQATFDHGAQYFTARAPGFRAQVDAWEKCGVVSPWPLPASDAWIGTPGMNAIIKAMAGERDVRWNSPVDRIERDGEQRGGEQRDEGWRLRAGTVWFTGFDAVVLAVPAEQALPFLSLHDFAMAREVMLARSQPCWTAMFAFADRVPGAIDMLRDAGPIGWAARNAAKPGRSGVEGWVVQARADWSTRHLEYSVGEIAALLLDELAAALGIDLPELIAASAHRWRYAMSAGLGLGALWNAESGLGVCGDWLLGPRVECAWLSGQELARQILDVPPDVAQGPRAG
ncbi:MAG: NAD(P)-binding protein [Novosphingobium sp.]|nr:NAD(P)-binding protein [Novosphingobium sp.]